MTKWDALRSSKSDEYPTPSEIYEQLDNEFKFTLDPCATDENHKCKRYFTKEEDGLKQSWAKERVFCNPPYSEIGKWVKKAYDETRQRNTLVCMLIPSRTDTRWFHDYIYHRTEIRFVKGRMKFGQEKYNAPFPSMIVIFRGAEIRDLEQNEIWRENDSKTQD